VRLMVEDSGPGVPSHLVNKIFEPFFTTKEVGAGTGLGLSIAHSLMSEHQGRILYQTSSLGGAGFVLQFPPASPDDLARQAGSDTTSITRFNTAEPVQPTCAGHILILDDEKSIAEMLGEMLDLLGYSATLCNTGADALGLLDQREFDLVISDYRMPQMNGRQFYEAAIKNKPSLAQRFIFLTGDVVNDDTRMYLDSIGSPHLAKPFNLRNVKAVIAQSLASKDLASSPA